MGRTLHRPRRGFQPKNSRAGSHRQAARRSPLPLETWSVLREAHGGLRLGRRGRRDGLGRHRHTRLGHLLRRRHAGARGLRLDFRLLLETTRRECLEGVGDPGALVHLRGDATGLQQRVGVLIPFRIREIVTEHSRGGLRLGDDAEGHVGFHEAIERLLHMGRRLVLGDDHLVAVDGGCPVALVLIVAADGHLVGGEHIHGDADAIFSLPCVGAVGIALAQDLEFGEGLARRRLVAHRIADFVEARRGDDVMGERCVLRARMERRVTLCGGHGFRILAGLVVGVGGHHDRAARLGGIGVIAVEILEPAGGVGVGAAIEEAVGLGVHLVRWIRVQQLGVLGRLGAAGEKAARNEQSNDRKTEFSALPQPVRHAASTHTPCSHRSGVLDYPGTLDMSEDPLTFGRVHFRLSQTARS